MNPRSIAIALATYGGVFVAGGAASLALFAWAMTGSVPAPCVSFAYDGTCTCPVAHA